MSKIGDGYGSEFHFLRYRRESPAALDAAILREIGRPDGTIEWSYPRGVPHEGEEPEGMAFLDGRPDVERQWAGFWPQKGRQPSWDGVARLVVPGFEAEWLLFEAKANHPEFCSPPSSAGGEGRRQIEAAMTEVKQHLGVHRFFRWLGTYYQHANRLATLYFLARERVPARLVDVFFVGDRFPDGTPCPGSEAEWRDLIQARRLTLGLPEQHALSDRVHEVFLSVAVR